MLDQAPGVTGEMPVGAAPVGVPDDNQQAPMDNAPQSSEMDDGATGEPTAPIRREPTQPVSQPPTQPQPQRQQADPALIPWAQEGVRLLQRKQQVDERKASLQSEQAAADRATTRALERVQSIEERDQVLRDYHGERAMRESQYQAAMAEEQNLAREDEHLGRQFAMWGRERHMERIAEPMALDLLVRQTAARNPDPQFPVQELYALLQGVPPNAQLAVRDNWEKSYQSRRLPNRAASGVDNMGNAGTGAAFDRDKYTGKDLIQMEIERLLKR